MKASKRKIMKGSLEAIILSELSRKPMHGYGLIVAIKKKFLNDLESRALLKAEWDFSNSRPRKVYCITPLGEKELNDAALFLEMIAKELCILKPT